jgi:excisionase family DNA binding protein
VRLTTAARAKAVAGLDEVTRAAQARLLGRWLERAAERAGIEHIVYSAGTGPDHHRIACDQSRAIEEHFWSLGLPLTVLRPTTVMEEIAWYWLSRYRSKLVLATPFEAQSRLPLIAVDDIAALAVTALAVPDDFLGRTIAVAGEVTRQHTPARMGGESPVDKSQIEVGRKYALREKVSAGQPLLQVQVLEIGRGTQIKVRRLSEPHEGLEEQVRTRQLVVAWGERQAFLKDEELARIFDEARQRPNQALHGAIETVMEATGYADGGADDDGTVHMEAVELREIARLAGLPQNLEDLHGRTFEIVDGESDAERRDREFREGGYLKPQEAADLLRVDARTVKRWAQQGKLDAFRTPGGHWRIKREAVRKMRQGEPRVVTASTVAEVDLGPCTVCGDPMLAGQEYVSTLEVSPDGTITGVRNRHAVCPIRT